MHVLVTGATGFVGRAVVHALRARNHNVTAFVRTPSKAKDLEAIGTTLAVGDMTAPADYTPLVSQVDTVVHAAQYGTSGRMTRAKLTQLREANLLMTKALADACVQRDKRLIYTSGCFVYGDQGEAWVSEETPQAPSPLGVGHHQAPSLGGCARHGGCALPSSRRVSCTAPAGSSRRRLLIRSPRGSCGSLAAGKTTGARCMSKDLAQAYALAVETGADDETLDGEIFNVVDDSPLRLRELVDTLTDTAGKPRVGSVPPWLLKLIIGGPIVDSLVTSFRVGNAKAKLGLDWTPRYGSFQEGLPGVLETLGVHTTRLREI